MHHLVCTNLVNYSCHYILHTFRIKILITHLTSFCRSTFSLGFVTKTSFMRSTFLAEISTTSYQRSTFPKGNLDEIDNIYTYAFIYYNLSAVPKGGGGLGSFSCMPIILAVPLVVHRRIYALHHPPHHHIQREERQPHRHVIHTPLRQTPIFHGKKHYYCITLLLFLSATRCISVL